MVFRPTKKENKEFKKAAKEWADGKHEAVTEKYGDISTWDTSEITDMSKLFKDKPRFNGDISNWDVSNVTNMQEMFYNANSFNQPIGNWNVSKVTNMKGMFEDAHTFNKFIGSWDVSNVENMGYMFSDAYAFNNGQTNNEGNAPLDWNVSKVTNMWSMFTRARAFNQPIGNWDVSNVTDMFSMFHSADSFNQSIENWDVSKLSLRNDMEIMFKDSGYEHTKPDIELSKQRNQRNREKQTLTNIAIEQKYTKPSAKRQVLGQVVRNSEGKVEGVTGTTGLIDSYLGGKRKTRKSKRKSKKSKRKTRKTRT